MMKTRSHYLAAVLLTTCMQLFLQPQATAQQSRSLKERFKNDFLIGVALNAAQVTGSNSEIDSLVAAQFAAVTPENVMKSSRLHPTWHNYDFRAADQLIHYASRQRLKVNGHTLIWHSQLPGFVKDIRNKDSFRLFFEDHINTVAGHFAGKVFSWDVVNEALAEDGSLRQSIFLERLGEGYIVEAFRLAAAASPGTALYYNDYNIELPAKRAGCIALVKQLQAAGVRLDGVGIQGHWHLGKIPLAELEASIIAYAALGLEVMITELDIDVLPRTGTGADIAQSISDSAGRDPYPNGLPDHLQQQLAADYESIFRLLLKHRDKISRVTFWGLHDGASWLNNWPQRGRTNHPLLFDRQLNPKPAFFKVTSLP